MEKQLLRPDIMIDIETLDTVSTAIVLSIGAVAFNRRDMSVPFDTLYLGFGTKDCREDQKLYGRTMSRDTVNWWNKQSEGAKQVLREKNVESVNDALVKLVNFIKRQNCEPYVWGNGSNFDNVIVSSLLADYGIPQPWKWINDRCFRTMKSEHGHIIEPVQRLGVHHNALDDAIHQAKWLQIIFKELQNSNLKSYKDR